MASGRYQVATGHIKNPYEGITSSLNNVSKTLLDAAYREDQAERQDARDLENDRRWDLSNARQEATHKSQQDEIAREQAATDWYKTINANYTDNDLKRRVGKTQFGLTDEDFEKYGDKLYNIIPIGLEDAQVHYGKEFVSKHGGTFDIARMPVLGNVQSWAALQKSVDDKADLLQQRSDAEVKFLFNVHKAANGTSTRNKIKSFGDINTLELAKRYQDNAWFNPANSHKQDAHKVFTTLKDLAKSKGYSPQETYDALIATMEHLTDGSNLDKIDSSADASTLFTDAVEKHRELKKNGVLDSSYSTLEDFAKGLPKVTGYNVRNEAIAEAEKRIAALRNGSNGTSPSASTTGKVDQATLDRDILARTGLDTLLPNDEQASANTPKVSFRNNQGEDTLSTPPRETVLQDNVADLTARMKNTYSKLREATTQEERDAITDRYLTLEQEREKSLTKLDRVNNYQQQSGIVQKVNETFGKGAIPTDTLMVLPYDKEGEDRSWADVVADINHRPGINFGDQISRKEYEEAKGNPELQQKYIDNTNRLIARDILFRTATGRMGEQLVDTAKDVYSYSPIAAILESMSTFDPTSEDYKKSVEEKANLSQTRKDKEIARSILDSTANTMLGRDPAYKDKPMSQAVDSFTGFVADSPSAARFTLLAAAPRAVTAVPGTIRLVTVIPRLRNWKKARTVLKAEKPQVRQTKGPDWSVYDSPPSRRFVGPRMPRDMNPPTKPPRTALEARDAKRLEEWLRTNAVPR